MKCQLTRVNARWAVRPDLVNIAELPEDVMNEILHSLDDGSMQNVLASVRMVSKRFRALTDAQVVSARLSFSTTSIPWQALLLKRLENLEELNADLRNDSDGNTPPLFLLLHILQARPALRKLDVVCHDKDPLHDQLWPLNDLGALQETMQNLKDLQTLSLGGYGSVSVSTQMLCSALQHVSPLKELLVRFAIGNAGVHRLAPCIQGNQTVVRLNLSGTAIGDVGAVALASCIADNVSLEDLDLSHNSMGVEGATAIATALARNSRLLRLSLAHNTLADPGVSAFGHALGANSVLCYLDLQYNNIGSTGMGELCCGLEVNSGLTKLDLSGNDAQAGSAAVLAKALAVNTALLELKYCDTRLDDSVHALALGLAPNLVLRSLSLSNNCIGRVGAASLAAVLACSIPGQAGMPALRPLVHLDLSHNSLGDAGVAEMASSLQGAHGLKTLKLVNCDIGSIGAETLGQCMEFLSLEVVNVNRNYVADPGALSLGLALQRHGKCQELHLQFNGVRDSGAMALAVALKRVTSLRLVDLQGNSFPFTRAKLQSLLHCCDHEVQLLY